MANPMCKPTAIATQKTGKPKLAIAAALIAAMASLPSAACTSTYLPRPSKSLKWTMVDGEPAVLRQGQVYPVNGFGSGLLEAVADNPRALEHAHAHRDGTVYGLLTALGGAAVMFASPVLLLADGGNDGGGPSSGSVGLALGGAVTGMVLYGFGLGMVVAAQPRMYDAVNVYNDDLEAGALSHPPIATALPSAPTPASLPAAPTGQADAP